MVYDVLLLAEKLCLYLDFASDLWSIRMYFNRHATYHLFNVSAKHLYYSRTHVCHIDLGKTMAAIGLDENGKYYFVIW